MQNPLIECGEGDRLPDFPAIGPAHVVPALEARLTEYREGVEQLLGSPGKIGWKLAETEARLGDRIARAWSPVSHLNSVADDADLRKAFNDGLERLTVHGNWRQQHEGLYRAYRALKESADFNDLSPAQQRVVDLELRDFHLAGVDLPAEDKEAYREIMLRLSRLGSKFSENLLDATRAWTRHFESPDALAGLPEAELNLLRGIARSNGREGWMADLNAPSYQAIMTNADDRELRQEIYTAFVTRASDQGPDAGRWDNSPLIAEILALRHQLAVLLGFENYVEYALASRMAESPRSALEFLTGLAVQARPAAQEQFDALQAYAREQGAEHGLEAWDVAYWAERYRQDRLGLSDEELKPYFPAELMLDALRFTAEALFGIRLVPDDSISTWHPDVRYCWLENRDGRRFAGLYMDLYARRDKRGGAWMDVCRNLRATRAGRQEPVAYLTCNFAPPVDSQPSLLTHNDMQTLFHEFGHCLHHLLTEIEWPQVNGISNVEWDAVELPSQLLENWCWEEQVLDRFARHFETGAPLPQALKERLLRSRTFQKALFLVRQLEYGICDLELHLDYDPEQPVDPVAVHTAVRRQVAVTPAPGWIRFLNGFGHIFGGGYAAGYYSYLWAEQLSADAWGKFTEQGALSAETGEMLWQEILSVGASRPAMDSFVAFRGRQPDPAPLLEMYGLELEK